MKLSPDQQAAVDTFGRWLKSGGQRFALAGLAGTGKSTISSHIVDMVGRDRVAVVAPTGKAASVLRRKGHEDARTVHSLIYKPMSWCDACDRPRTEEEQAPAEPELDELPAESAWCECGSQAKPRVRFRRTPLLLVDYVMCDEASMVSGDIVDDLESYGARIIYIGDHGQLAPVGNDPEIMREDTADAVLSQIHRQGEGSQIVSFAHAFRQDLEPEDAALVIEQNGEVEVLGKNASRSALVEADIVICGRNRTRVKLNEYLRGRKGFYGTFPQVGERVICLRNDRDNGIYNGMLATVDNVRVTQEPLFREAAAEVGVFDLTDDEGRKLKGLRFYPAQFGEEKPCEAIPRRIGLFDFGYAITCHKSQGSEWAHVAVCDESECFRGDAPRWRYTAATRAAERLTWYL